MKILLTLSFFILLFLVKVLLALVDHLSQSLSVFATAYCLDRKTRVRNTAPQITICSTDSITDYVPPLLLFLQQPGLTDFIPGLLSAEQIASTCRQWRLHSTLLEQFSFLSSCLTSDQLCARITPLLIKHISSNVSTVQFVCA